jgi:hypothetical protein
MPAPWTSSSCTTSPRRSMPRRRAVPSSNPHPSLVYMGNPYRVAPSSNPASFSLHGAPRNTYTGRKWRGRKWQRGVPPRWSVPARPEDCSGAFRSSAPFGSTTWGPVASPLQRQRYHHVSESGMKWVRIDRTA